MILILTCLNDFLMREDVEKFIKTLLKHHWAYHCDHLWSKKTHRTPEGNNNPINKNKVTAKQLHIQPLLPNHISTRIRTRSCLSPWACSPILNQKRKKLRLQPPRNSIHQSPLWSWTWTSSTAICIDPIWLDFWQQQIQCSMRGRRTASNSTG